MWFLCQMRMKKQVNKMVTEVVQDLEDSRPVGGRGGACQERRLNMLKLMLMQNVMGWCNNVLYLRRVPEDEEIEDAE
ncbi:hypothetical protein Taro_012236 [Colocasia esculenta]|uniref:Uncharacterized protein n=1 Tax=Colocasia esculenta TaxID=4460 RepID=A0A843U8J6_COLES|nr:hypothetical protein [Colocasia esculenta]